MRYLKAPNSDGLRILLMGDLIRATKRKMEKDLYLSFCINTSEASPGLNLQIKLRTAYNALVPH